jgi:uncharacterized membrane protein
MTGALSVFLVLSSLFGSALIAAVPPMRGPDEPAHFVRAYAISQGDFIPAASDEHGRKGTLLPLRLQQQMEVFELARDQVTAPDFSFAPIFEKYEAVRRASTAGGNADHLVFNLYGGSEAYSPIPYLPYMPCLIVARLLQLDFLPTLYLTRLTGFAVLTALVAYAIAAAPGLSWAFLGISMLPSALYGRVIVSADGMTLALTLVLVALCFRRLVYRTGSEPPIVQSVCTCLCVLCKPPQIMLVALQFTEFRGIKRWRSIAIVLPAVVLGLSWAILSSSDLAQWRIMEPHETQQFNPIWRIGFMLQNPLHLPTLLAGSAADALIYARQLIGVLGWLDAPLWPAVYPVLGLLIPVTFLSAVDLARAVRRRVVILYLTVAVAYVLIVFVTFYIVWTPIGADRIRGVQGRYFLIVLPILAVAISMLVARGLSVRARAAASIGAAVISVAATLEAVLRVDWRLW